MKSGKLYGFTEEEFKEKVHPFNQEIVNSFIDQQHLSDQTLKQYRSAINIFFKFVYEKCMNKPIYELRKRDALNFQNFLINAGLSSSGIKMKRSVVSSMCNYVELYYGDDYPKFRNIFSKGMPNVASVKKKEKVPLTMDEINKIIKELTKREEWQKIAYIWYTYSTGCRREETRQLLVEVINYKKYVDKEGTEKNFYVTHSIRAKGRGKSGKVRTFTFDERAMSALKKWLDVRSDGIDLDDCQYVFVSKLNGKYKQVSPNTFNLWCLEFSDILGGKAVHPHLFRSSRATNAVVDEGKSIEAVKQLLGHESSETTQIYVVRDTSSDLDELF